MDLTRRQALGLGAAALGALRFPATALASNGPDLFEVPLGRLHARTWRVTDVIRPGKRFDLVGLRWSKHASVQGQVRARRANGRWTRWTSLPHAHAAVDGTDPAFTNTADELQFRLRGRAQHLTARFVRALPHAPAPRAHASQAGVPAMVMRDGWGAERVPPRAAPQYGQVQAAFVHHTAGTIDYAPEDSPGIVLGIARYHRDSNGWNDIGYNFLVDRYGTIFEGRAGGIEAAVVGAQAQGYNSNSTGIACLGTFTNIPLDAPAMDSLARLIGWKLSLHGVPTEGTVTLASMGGPTNRYRSGTPVVFNRISGHRDADQTTCPGDSLYAQLPDLRERATRYAVPVSAITVKAASQKGIKPTWVSGFIHFADGSSAAGVPLSIEYTNKDIDWTPVSATNAGPDGRWTTSVVLPVSGHVRAVFAGDGARPRVESAPLRVKVVPSMNLVTDKRRAKAGTPFAVSGRMNPAQKRLTCLLERQVGRRWVTVQRKHIRTSRGQYATKVRPTRPGLYRVSIIADGVRRRRTLRALH
jgi:hypothetical protein